MYALINSLGIMWWNLASVEATVFKTADDDDLYLIQWQYDKLYNLTNLMYALINSLGIMWWNLASVEAAVFKTQQMMMTCISYSDNMISFIILLT